MLPLLALVSLSWFCSSFGADADELQLPLKAKSVRFAVIGDSGTGGRPQYELAARLVKVQEKFPFEFVIMLGDNIYGSTRPDDYRKKFEIPYQPLLDGGIKFYASLGNHDPSTQPFYKPFNMEGKRYYSFKKGDVEFYALDSNYMDPEQMTWLTRQLSASGSRWKVAFFHHPLYSNARFHGPDIDLRKRLEPVLREYGVNVVFTGHEHVYERLKPQSGIFHFVLGNSGQLRRGDLRRSENTAKGFDTDLSFAIVEVAGDEMFFQAISRTGATVDSGVLKKQEKPARTETSTVSGP
ncbi:MAG TPA: metallophosphoesterase [Bryobacteraceae bacterium]|nr:metallophosphoesterase [Bryobacteraceae bacterium]